MLSAPIPGADFLLQFCRSDSHCEFSRSVLDFAHRTFPCARTGVFLVPKPLLSPLPNAVDSAMPSVQEEHPIEACRRVDVYVLRRALAEKRRLVRCIEAQVTALEVALAVREGKM